MKKFLSKGMMVILSLCMFFSVGIINSSYSEVSEDVFVVANAASKKIRLKKSKVTLDVGESYTQKLIGTNGKNIPAKKIKWKSSNKKVATVSKKGKVTAKKSGKVKITATYMGKKYTFTVIAESDEKQTGNTGNRGDSDADDTNGAVVYVTPTGKRYHLDPQCGGKNSREADIEYAKSIGLTPCKTCAS